MKSLYNILQAHSLMIYVYRSKRMNEMDLKRKKCTNVIFECAIVHYYLLINHGLQARVI